MAEGADADHGIDLERRRMGRALFLNTLLGEFAAVITSIKRSSTPEDRSLELRNGEV